MAAKQLIKSKTFFALFRTQNEQIWMNPRYLELPSNPKVSKLMLSMLGEQKLYQLKLLSETNTYKKGKKASLISNFWCFQELYSTIGFTREEVEELVEEGFWLEFGLGKLRGWEKQFIVKWA